MKHVDSRFVLFFGLLVLSLASSVQAQDWSVVPLGTTDDIYAIENTPLSHRTVAGANGFAAISNTDRTQWTILDTGTTANLYSAEEPTGEEFFFGAGSGVVRLRVYTMWFERDLPEQADFRLFGGATAVGPAGHIYRTTDAGNTWTPGQNPSTADLYAGTGTQTWAAWAVGSGGTVLRTMDGLNWSTSDSRTTAALYSVVQVGFTQVWAVGEGGTILKSTDGGVTWNLRLSGTSATLRAVSVSKVNPRLLIAAGLQGTVLKSTDAGETWCRLNAGSGDFYAAEAVNDTEYFVGGAGGLLLRTTDGGGPCIDPLGITPTVSLSNGIEGPFPQPCTDAALFRIPSGIGGVLQTEVFDSAGRLVVRDRSVPSAAGGGLQLDTSGWKAGVYWVRLRNAGAEVSRRLVVVR